MTEKTIDTIRDFLSLPHEALPSPQFLDEANEDLGDAWPWLHDYAGDCERPYWGQRVRLHADRPEWRDGVVVTLD